jgi:H+/gluconate symporter-like permease
MEVSNVSMVVIGYAVYLPVAIFLTYLVAKTLFKNGKVFMLDIFRGREEIANSTNKLFQMGFYLLNIGFALLILKIYHNYDMSAKTLIEILSAKLGGFSIYLGIMLFLNLYMFFRGKRKTSQAIRHEKLVDSH